MMPWAHLAVGYVVYTVWTRLSARRAPVGAAVIALAFGTQVPDLIDKPLNFWLSVYDGRAVGHSLLTALPLCLGVWLVARRRGHGRLGCAFAIGVVTHLLSDAQFALVDGVRAAIRNGGRLDLVAAHVRHGAPYLVWPVYPAPTYARDSLTDHVAALLAEAESLRGAPPTEVLDSGLVVQALLFGCVLGIWAVDGYPGVAELRAVADRYR